MKRLAAVLGGVVLALCSGAASAKARNLVIFVADGLRAQSVTAETAPTLHALARRGVSFPNSHSVFPTITTVNGAAIATGHLPGDTGEYGNSFHPGYSSRCPLGKGVVGPVVQAENDCVLRELNDRLGGGENYLNEASLLAAADERGFSTAAIGKLGPTAIQRIGSFQGRGGGTVLVDDVTGQSADAPPLAADVTAAMQAAGLLDVAGAPPRPPARRAQTWFTDVATKVLLPRFTAAKRPFVLVYWCRDPDATQHGQTDSLDSVVPGINGPSSRAAIGTADQALAGLLAALKAQGLDASTDIMVTADHGFSTVSRNLPAEAGGGEVARGSAARTVAMALGLPLFETTAAADPANARPLAPGATPRGGDALIGTDPAHPSAIVAANSGTDLIYLPGADARSLAPRIAAALQKEPWLGGLFVRDDLGRVPGTLPFSDIGYLGSGRTPRPAMTLTFRTFVAPGCALGEELCSVLVPDSSWRTGQGTHGSLGRGETHIFMAAAGPSFKAGYVDPAPVGNADLAPTAARLLDLNLKGKGRLSGRVLSEALKGGVSTPFRAQVVHSAPGPGGLVMTLKAQTAAGRRYVDAGGYPGRVVGLKPAASGR